MSTIKDLSMTFFCASIFATKRFIKDAIYNHGERYNIIVIKNNRLSDWLAFQEKQFKRDVITEFPDHNIMLGRGVIIVEKK